MGMDFEWEDDIDDFSFIEDDDPEEIQQLKMVVNDLSTMDDFWDISHFLKDLDVGRRRILLPLEIYERCVGIGQITSETASVQANSQIIDSISKLLWDSFLTPHFSNDLDELITRLFDKIVAKLMEIPDRTLTSKDKSIQLREILVTFCSIGQEEDENDIFHCNVAKTMQLIERTRRMSGEDLYEEIISTHSASERYGPPVGFLGLSTEISNFVFGRKNDYVGDVTGRKGLLLAGFLYGFFMLSFHIPTDGFSIEDEWVKLAYENVLKNEFPKLLFLTNVQKYPSFSKEQGKEVKAFCNRIAKNMVTDSLTPQLVERVILSLASSGRFEDPDGETA